MEGDFFSIAAIRQDFVLAHRSDGQDEDHPFSARRFGGKVFPKQIRGKPGYQRFIVGQNLNGDTGVFSEAISCNFKRIHDWRIDPLKEIWWFRKNSSCGVALQLRRCSVPVRTLHSSVFARLASGAFYETSGWMTFCEVTKFIDHYKWRSVFFKLNLDGFVKSARGQARRLRNLHKLFLVDEIIPEALEYDSAN
ncbi:MAG: hypothetical protein EHM27_05710 [Deltaproteobacteria bacterium]|nr:MAG: hypothetical protein EHM27_05710 [Deltaproteobacteria bacterium]